jgi:hypothetical protein
MLDAWLILWQERGNPQETRVILGSATRGDQITLQLTLPTRPYADDLAYIPTGIPDAHSHTDTCITAPAGLSAASGGGWYYLNFLSSSEMTG